MGRGPGRVRAASRSVVVHVAVPAKAGPEAADTPKAQDVSRAQDGSTLQDGPGPARVGFAVSKAVGPAVTRNRVRRRLQALVAERLEGLEPGTDLVVRALPPAAGLAFADLGRDLDSALSRARRQADR